MEFFQFAWGVLVPIMGFLINEHRKNKKRRLEREKEQVEAREFLQTQIDGILVTIARMQAYIDLKVAVAEERDRLLRERAND